MKKKPAARSAKKKTPRRSRRTPAEEKLRRLCRQTLALRREVEASKARMQRFEEEKVPAFERWVDQEFADLKREADQVDEELSRAECVLARSQHVWQTRSYPSRQAAYDAVAAELKEEIEEERRLDAAEAGTQGGEAPGGGDEEEGEEFDEEVDEVFVEGMFEAFMAEMRGVDVEDMDPVERERARAEFRSTFDHAARGDRLAFEKALLGAGADRSEENLAAVKASYRRLAKRLHPDHNGGAAGELEKSLWEEATLLYQALDAEGLQQVEIILSLERGEDLRPDQGPLLRRYKEALEFECGEISMDLFGAREHPAWNFDPEAPDPRLRRSVAAELAEVIDEGRAQLRSLQARIKRWLGARSGQAGGGKPAVSRQRARSQAAARQPASDAWDQAEFPF